METVESVGRRTRVENFNTVFAGHREGWRLVQISGTGYELQNRCGLESYRFEAGSEPIASQIARAFIIGVWAGKRAERAVR